MNSINLDKTDEILEKYPADASSIIPALQAVQETYGYVPEAAMDRIAEKLNVPASKIYGIVTFYSQFYLKPHGKNVICTCQGTACHVRGSKKLLAELEKELNIKDGETTQDQEFSLKSVACLGACALAPLMVVNKTYYGNTTPDQIAGIIESHRGKE